MDIIKKVSDSHISDVTRTGSNFPNGARYCRCALQIYPFTYIQRHNQPTAFKSEVEYNHAIIDTCREDGIEVIGVTDHYRVRSSMSLMDAAREVGISAFTGLKAVSKEGVHFLCLFDSEKNDHLEQFIDECGISKSEQTSPIGSLDTLELLAKIRGWGGVTIAAHVMSRGGMISTLQGQRQINAWKSPHLLACYLPGPLDNVPIEIQQILQNKNPEYQRLYDMAIINASEVNSPEGLKMNDASCFIKMSEVSVEALRQAFLDPQSRIRLHSNSIPDPHAELVSMHWEGGFLGGNSVHFNGNLNTIIGGRGTGKSTILESLRYVLGLEPIGEDARKVHESIVKHVLKSGTRVSLQARSHLFPESHFHITRSVPNPPTIMDENGDLLTILPQDAISHVQVFGQHEISELAKSPDKCTLLLERFADQDSSITGRKAELKIALEKSRNSIIGVQNEMKMLQERLAILPGLEEVQKRYREVGLEEKLKEKSLLVKEEHLFSIVNERLDAYQTLYQTLAELLPIDAAFVSDKALCQLPNAKNLGEINRILAVFSTRLEKMCGQFVDALSEANIAITTVRERWDQQRNTVEMRYEQMLRDLQKSSMDGTEFIERQKQIEALSPLNDRLSKLMSVLKLHVAQRHKLLLEWEEIAECEFHALLDAANRITIKLDGQVKVSVIMAGNRKRLETVLRGVGGHLGPTLERLIKVDSLSLRALSKCCREGQQSLMSTYSLPPGAAKRLADAGPDLHMKIEEVELPATTHIELNIAAKDQPVEWKTIDQLSSGQKATAILLLLLLESEAPLVIDQPEDDLDNRFISEKIVPVLRQQKQKRQFIFSTHNANIPVLGDAELILGLSAAGEAEDGQATIDSRHMGSIDSHSVKELVEETLEGGKYAFEIRRSKYGF